MCIDVIFLLQGVTGSPGNAGPDGKVGPAVSFVPTDDNVFGYEI